MQTRTLYKSGNSVVVAIPAYMLDELGWHSGDTIRFSRSPRKGLTLLLHAAIDSAARATELQRSTRKRPITR